MINIIAARVLIPGFLIEFKYQHIFADETHMTNKDQYSIKMIN
jgi:hypothetical protein